VEGKKLLFLLLASILVIGTAAPAMGARSAGITILADLSHNQPPTGLDIIMKMMPEAHWYILVSSQDQIDSLPPLVKTLADKILVGTFATVADQLGTVDVILVGQPVKEFTPDEIQAIHDWFYSNYKTVKVIWLAGDSDYPAQGGNLEIAMHTINSIAESLGTSLREDYVSVEDYTSNTGAPYRVVGLVEPDPGAEVVAFGAHKVLFHGPGVIAYVDENGNWKPLNETKPSNVYRIVWTTDNAAIVEHQPQSPGAPGDVGQAYTRGDTGRFPLLAAEVMNVTVEGNPATRVVIMSGESPYGDYQPGVTWIYYGINLDGPRFVRNLLLWATGYMGELKEAKALMDQINTLNTQVSSLKQDTQSKVQNLQSQIQSLQGQVQTLQKQLSDTQQQLTALQQKAGGKGAAYSGLGLAIIAIIIAAWAVAAKKPK
jgi:uncharacterized protein YukE